MMRVRKDLVSKAMLLRKQQKKLKQQLQEELNALQNSEADGSQAVQDSQDNNRGGGRLLEDKEGRSDQRLEEGEGEQGNNEEA
jgi:hypothetical protein